MKKLVAVAAAALMLATASSALADNDAAKSGGNGAGLAAHIAKFDAKVAKIAEKCAVPNAPAKCATAKATISSKLDDLAAKLQTKLTAHPNNATLKAALDEITVLKSHL